MTYDDYVDNLKDSADAAKERQEYLESLPAELAALRDKLAAAEEHGEQYRKNWKSLQDLTGEQCLDRARYAVKAWREAAAQLAAAVERAEKAERERDEMAKRNRALREVVDTQIGQIEAACKQAEAAEARAEKAESDTLSVIDERDAHEESLNRLFSALGMDEASATWSSANDPVANAVERAEALRAAEAERDALRQEVAQLRGNVAAANLTADLSSGREFDAVMEYDALARQNAALRAALEVFGNGSVIEAIEREDFSVMKERIVDWFGPSDFKKAKSALALTPPAGGEAGKDSARLDFALAHIDGDYVLGGASAEGYWDDMEAEHIGDEREHLRAWRRAIDAAMKEAK